MSQCVAWCAGKMYHSFAHQKQYDIQKGGSLTLITARNYEKKKMFFKMYLITQSHETDNTFSLPLKH